MESQLVAININIKHYAPCASFSYLSSKNISAVCLTNCVLCCVCRAQSAMGNSEVEDPFLKLRKKIIWKAVFHKTLSVQLLKKVLLYVLFSCTVRTFSILNTVL